MSQLTYDNQSTVIGIPGEFADNGYHDLITLLNAGAQSKQTIGTVTVAGTIASETFDMVFVGTSPTNGAFTTTISHTASSGTATSVATALVAAINADEDLNDVLVASNVAGVITLTINRYKVNPITSVTNTASGSATITASPTVTNYADAAVIPFGYAVGQYSTGTEDSCSVITTSSNLTIMGIAHRSFSVEAEYPFNAATVAGWPANSTVEIIRKGRVFVKVASAVTRNTVPAVLNATGQLTVTGAGSSTALTGSVYRTAAAAGGIAIVEINLP